MKKLLVVAAAVLFSTAASTLQSVPAAVVVGLDGSVRVERGGGSSRPAAVGTRLEPGDRVLPASGARAVLVRPGGVRTEVTAAFTVESGEAGEDRDDEEDLFSRAVAVLARVAGADVDELMDRQGMIRPIPGEPVPAAPGNGLAVLTSRPRFTWHPADGASTYTLQIRRVGGPPVRFGEISDTTWTYPASAPPLIPGEEYRWTVAPEGSGRAAREQRFRVVGPDAYAALTRDLRALGGAGLDPAGDGGLLAAVAFRDAGLFYEAARALERLERSGAELDADVYLLKGEVLSTLGDPSGARAAFDRADRMRP